MTQKQKTYDIITIGGSTIDIFLRPSREGLIIQEKEDHKNLLCFQHGGKLIIDELHQCFGGGGSNTATAFSRLGLKTAVCAAIGKDEWGEKIIKHFAKERVDTSFLVKKDQDTTGLSVIINSFDGERTVLYTPGANRNLRQEDISESILSGTRWIFINRISSDFDSIFQRIVKYAKKDPDLNIAWNPGGKQIREGMEKYKELLAHTNLLFLNREEAQEFSKPKEDITIQKGYINIPKKKKDSCMPPAAKDCTELFEKISDMGPKHIVITDGNCGSQMYHNNVIYYCPTVSDKRVDTLGAGDSFASGCTYGFLQGLPLQTALKFGTINATSVVQFYGAQAGLLTKRQLQEGFEKTDIQTTQYKIH